MVGFGRGLSIELVGSEQANQILTLVGEIDVASAEGLAEVICGVQGSPVIVDIAGVTFMDSTGIAQFVRARANLESNGNLLIIRRATSIVRRIFAAVGMSDWLEDERGLRT
jgi:anti-anti-sigma factor